MGESAKSAEAKRILERYVCEVVVEFDLCPWARTSRRNGEIGVEILLGTPTIADWIAGVRRAFAPGIRVAMVVAPELTIELAALHEVRNAVTAQLPETGVAEFHPHAAFDLATPARLVPFLRRSPDPMLQVVPLALLAGVRTTSLPDRAQQAQILSGVSVESRDIAAQIATANHAMVAARHAEIEAALTSIAEDRRTSYARVGISACP
jgi:hypothetical protein